MAYIVVACAFTIINPALLAFKAWRQLKLSTSHKKPLQYTIDDQGITISQDELSQTMQWNMICRILMTQKILAVYTSSVHAFVIPLSELGEDKGKIITAIVQFSASNNPRLSKNLKRFQSGKGI